MDKNCYKVTGVTATATELTLNTAVTGLSVCNGSRGCICLKDVELPSSTSILPVALQINGINITLLDNLGNTLQSDQIKCVKCLPGTWGTNTLHFKICAPRPRSQATPMSIIPEA